MKAEIAYYSVLIGLGCWAGLCDAQSDSLRRWSPEEKAFLQASENASADPRNVEASKALTQTSQELLNYYTRGEQHIDPNDLEARVRWYENALRTGNSLFDRTLDRKQEELTRTRNELLQRIEAAGREKDAARRLAAMREIERYKRYVPRILKMEEAAVGELFREYRQIPEGPARLQYLKTIEPFMHTAVGVGFFARARADLKNEIETAARDGRTLEAGVLADMALTLWPADKTFQDAARAYLENY